MEVLSINTKEIFYIVNEVVKTNLNSYLSTILDIAYLGSSSGHYGWHETRFCDFDIWVYVSNINDNDVYSFLTQITQSIKNRLRHIKVLAGAINGPYKPGIKELNEEYLFIHYLIDDDSTYKKRTLFTQASWSKYEAFVDKSLLKKLLIRTPSYADLLTEKCGINNAILILESGTICYEALDFINKKKLNLCFSNTSAQFVEFITHSVMMICRNRARLDKHIEPDVLSNEHFSEWYKKQYNDIFVVYIMNIKSDITNYGYGQIIKNITILSNKTMNWLYLMKNEVEVKLS